MTEDPNKIVLADQQDHCLNCNEKFTDTKFVYCPKCGQHTQDRLTLGILFRNTIASYFSLDSRFFRSLIPLLLMPGKVAREFVAGKRLKHLHPSQAYVMYSIVFFFLFSFYSRAWEMPELVSDGKNIEFRDKSVPQDTVSQDSLDANVVTMDSLKQELKEVTQVSKLDSLMAAGSSNAEITEFFGFPSTGVIGYFASKVIDVFRDKGSNLLGTVLAQIPLSMFLLVPIYAFILWLINVRRKKTYAENLAHSLYLFSFVFFILSLILILVWTTDAFQWLGLFFVLPPIYFLISFMKFYKQGFFKSLFKLGLVSILFSIIIIPVALALTATLTFLFY